MRPQPLALLALLAVITLGQTAAASPVESRADLDPKAPRPSLSIEVGVDGGAFRKTSAVSVRQDQRLALRLRPVAEASVRWYLVFPDLSRDYKNANFPWEDDAYAWVGYATLDYHRVELDALRDQWTVHPFEGEPLWKDVRAWHEANGPADASAYHDALGTFRFEAIVTTHDGRTLRTAGLEDANALGISNTVLRVTRRRDDGYVGHLTGFFNVPGIFGSVNGQSYHYLGVDCADLLTAAHARWRRRSLGPNVNVQMLVGRLRHVAETDLAEGRPADPVPWSKLRPGDHIAVRYDGGTRYAHIGALYEDDGDGLLGPEDLVLHAGPRPPHLSKLEEGAFDGHIVILRP